MINWIKLAIVAVTLVATSTGQWSKAAAQGRTPVHAETHMVSAANPFATRAGLEVLRRGGTAIDAAVAVQMVLTVVEPQSSGIGGGAFMLYYDQSTKSVSAFDGRETAPAAATEDLFLDDDGKPLGFFDALVGGRAVGAPGVLRMLELTHRQHGKLPWRSLFGDAIRLSAEGFPVSPRLHGLIAADRYLDTYPDTRRFFYRDDGTALAVGDILKNPVLADTFRIIASGGADALYEGALAHSIVAAVRSAQANPGLLSLEDLAGYEAKEREPVCRTYRAFQVCGMPPPTSGGITTLQILGILQNAAMAAESPWSTRAAHLFAEANRLAFADRGAYLADSDFVTVPIDDLLDPPYLKRRFETIREDRVLPSAAPGEFQNGGLLPMGGISPELPATTHFSIVDRWGNAVSVTSSIENVFGSRLMASGFLLNNQLTDFSFRAERAGKPVANRVQAGKRPRSSMSPTLVLDGSGDFRMAVGSPGGSRIIGYVAKTLIGVIDWRLDVQSAIDLPNLVNRGRRTEIEAGADADRLALSLGPLGHDVAVVPMTSGIHAIVRDERGLWGGADSRREGVALGD